MQVFFTDEADTNISSLFAANICRFPKENIPSDIYFPPVKGTFLGISPGFSELHIFQNVYYAHSRLTWEQDISRDMRQLGEFSSRQRVEEGGKGWNKHRDIP